ncbi:hypothetical protein GQ54DRAFT_303532 [Martensiomyces pterosporus]|nr:hypothetical protein GQ54DRAFT_303532 [Martensiomyces pterosporus]
MAFAAGAAVTIPTLGALGTIAYYAKHPQEPGSQQRRNSFMNADNHREFLIEDDPSDFSSFSSVPSIIDQRMERRKSMPMTSSFEDVKPDHNLLEDPQLQVWRDRYKWGRKYGMNFAHNDR